jgi:hypothetical protein
MRTAETGLAFGLALAAALGGMFGAVAEGRGAHALAPRGAGVSVALVDAGGAELPTWHHKGATWVAGNEGERYGVRLRNHTAERLEVVVTVDGRDVMSGETGDYKRQRGYILAPWQTATVEGFRTSMKSVASFRFTTPEDSYSSRMGTPQHVGVIGVAVFRERRVAEAPRPPVMARPTGDLKGGSHGASRGAGGEAPARMAPSPGPGEGVVMRDEAYGAGEPAARNNIGTQYGESRHSEVVQGHFARAGSQPAAVLGLFYDDLEGLHARGVPVGHQAASGGPDPFPGLRFAPPPPGR